MPISLELWRAAVERWVARIKRTLIIRRGVKRAPSDKEGGPLPSGQSHTGEKKCMVKKKGRKKLKNDSYGNSGITTDDFYDGIIALAATMMCFRSNASKDFRDKNPVAPLKELLRCTGLGPLLVVTMILILRSGDVEPNPGPVERVDVPISLEQCFTVTSLLAASIQQTLSYSVGLIKAPLSVPSREVALSPTGKPDDDKVQCLVNTTGRMKHKDGSFCDTMVTRDNFNVAPASVLESMLRDVKFTNGSDGKLVCTQIELKGLSQLLGIVHFFLQSGGVEANAVPVEGGPISHQEDGMVLDESLHVEVNNDYHCAKWIKSDLEASDNLRCRVSNDVPHLSSGKLANLVLSAKNAIARGMTALIAIFLWCMVLVDCVCVCIVGLLAFLLEVTLANMEKRKAGFKPGTAVTLHSPSQQACIFKSGLVIQLLVICVSVFKKYEHQTMSQQVCCLLVSHCASLLRDTKCTEKFLSLTFCFALLWHAICGKWLSRAVFKPNVFLRGLLLLAGDVETNPGPIQAEEVLLVYRDRFIAEVDASTVVMELLHRDVIDEVDQKVITMEHNPNKRNQILHECLMKKCTNNTLKTVCDVMIGIPGNPRMETLGYDMKRRLEMAHEVLLNYCDRFVSEADANAIVMELLHRDVIDEEHQRVIAMEHNPNRKNQILLACLMKKCTNNDLRIVCDVMIGISGNFRMAALGHDMKRELETGQEVLLLYTDQFISEVDANAVVMELFHRGIIDAGDRQAIAMEHNPFMKNRILLSCLKKKCTDNALRTVCDVMIGVPGNPRMAALGNDMRRRLEMGTHPAHPEGAAHIETSPTAGSNTVFAVITAYLTEESAVRHFLQLGGGIGMVWRGAHDCIWKNDPYLKSNKVTVTDIGGVRDCGYEVFTITREGWSKKLVGVHIKCPQLASFTSAQDTATTLFQLASRWKLQLTDIFSVGCCVCADYDQSKENLMGYVLLANQFESYFHRGKMAERTMQLHPEVYQTNRKWISDLQDHRITKPARQSGTDAQALVEIKDIPVKEVPRILSGPLVISDQFVQELRRVSYTSGIEMEAIGIIKALHLYEMAGNQNIPKFASVKGVSDFATSHKHSAAEATFFGVKTPALSDDERQQVATLHSIALVIRGVVERYLVQKEDFTEKDISELYQKAINAGPTITLHIAKAMTIGPPRVGKTCFRHHLLGLQPPERNPSTPVMKTAETISLSFVQSSTNDQRWIPLSANSGIVSLLEYLRKPTILPNEAASNEQAESPIVVSDSDSDLQGTVTELRDRPAGNVSPMATALPEHSVGNVLPTPSLVDKQPQVEHTSDDMQLLIDDLFEQSKSVKDQDKITLPDAHLLQFIDCGGQLAYHDIIPIFVNIPAIYLHVFNLLVELTECPEDCIRNEDGSDGFAAKSPLTVAQMMARSLLVIEDLACKKVQLPKEVAAEGTPQPSVAFVGTHYDTFCVKYGEQTEAKLKDISRELNKSVRIGDVKVMHHRCPKLPPMLFPVNNYAEKTTGDDDRSSLSMSWLKKAIEEEVFGVKVKVPVKWYLYQLMQWGMKEKKEQTYGELCKSCASVGLTDKGDIYAMVTYFHALGLLLHHCRNESTKHIEDAENCECLVFTDPSYLFENITKLYQVQFWRDEDVHGCLRDLKKYGKLTKDALTEIGIDINHKCFMDILVHLFIGADIESGNSVRSLFVPSVLTNSIDITGLSETGTTRHEHCVHFAIAFIHGNDTSGDKTFIPCGVFTGMIARLQARNGWEYSRNSISRLHVEFLVSTYTVKLYDHATHIGIVLKHEIDEKEAVEEAVDDFVQHCNTVIEATANSYCFLFHSNVTEHRLSKACGNCTARPYLILGRTCPKCTAPKDLHFLKVQKERGTLFVRCQKNGISYLDDTECIPLHQRNFHCAVVNELHTINPAQAEKKSGKNPPSVPASLSPRPVSNEGTIGRSWTEAGQPLAKMVLMECERSFYKVVAAKETYRELCQKKAIPQTVADKITNSRGVEEARGHLFDHIRDYGTINTLKVFCNVITSEEYDGFQAMQDFGLEMKRRLEQEGVSGEARGQECPPTTDGPHFVEHPTGDTRYDGSSPSMPTGDSTPAGKREDVRRIGVSGDARGQECIAPPTTTGPHFVEHPTGDTRYAANVTVQVVKDYTKEFLQEMDATAIALQLRVQGLIPESVKCDIDCSKCGEDANGHLLTFLLTGASEIQVQHTLKVASEKMDYGRMSQFAANVLQQLQPATKVTVQIIKGHREKFLQEMNATAIALQLQVQDLIPESVKCDIDRSKCRKDANGHLLTFLLTGAAEIQVQQTLKVASEKTDYGRMSQFAAKVLQQLQPACGGTSQDGTDEGAIIDDGGAGSKCDVTDGDDTDDRAYTSAEGQEDDSDHTPSLSQSTEPLSDLEGMKRAATGSAKELDRSDTNYPKTSDTTNAKRSATTKANISAATKAKRMTTARGSRQPASSEGTSQYTGTTTGLLPVSLCLTRLSMTQLASSGIHLYPPCDISCSRNTPPTMSAMVASAPATQPCAVTSDLRGPSAEDHTVKTIAPTHQTLRPRSKRAAQNLPSEISHSKRAKGGKGGGGGQR